MGEIKDSVKTGSGFDAATVSRGVRPVLTLEERHLVALLHNKNQAEMEVQRVVTTLEGLQMRVENTKARALEAGKAYALAVEAHAAAVAKAQAEAAKEVK